MKNMNKKTLLTGLIMASVAGTAMASGVNNIVNGGLGANAIAIGTSTVADGKNSIAFGAYVQSHSENTVAIGNSVTTNHENSVGIGSGVITNLNNSVGIGSGVVTNFDNNIAIGNGVTTNLTNNIGIGNGVITHHENSIGIGYGVVTNLDNNIAIGNGVVTHRKDNIGIGHGITTNGESSVAIGYGISTDGTNAIAIGNGASVVKDESIAIGHEAKANTVIGTSSYVINGETHNFAGTMPVGTVSIGDTNKERTITNVAAGRISSDSTYAINGSQLYAVVDEVETNANNIDKNAQAIATNKQNIKDIAIGLNMLGDVVNDHEQAIANNTKAISDLNKVTDNHGKVLIDHEGRIQTLDQDNKDIKSDVSNTQNQVNINTKDIADLKGKVGNVAAINNELNNKVNNLGQRVNKLGASSAALAGLHPLDFNRNDKASYAVSYGHYRNANAVALGAFYRPNERTMIGAGVSLGGETQLTLNVAFKTGKGSDYLAEAKDKDSRISKLEAMVQKLMAEVEQQKAVK